MAHQASDGLWYDKCPLCGGEGWHNEWVTGRQVMCHLCTGHGTVQVKPPKSGCAKYAVAAAVAVTITLLIFAYG